MSTYSNLRMDAIDRAIIRLLQQNGRMPNQQPAAEVGLTPAPCLARIRRLGSRGSHGLHRPGRPRRARTWGFQVMIYADLVAGDLANVEAFEERIVDMDE